MRIPRSLLLVLGSGAALAAGQPAQPPSPGDALLTEYFRAQTAAIHARAFAGVTSLADWERQREGDREKLREMLGLSPLPERTALHATITGREERDDFTVEKLHFQSRPGLYVTANLYLPKPAVTKAPAILYLCGHARVREGNVSFGSKAAYQQHGEWFARHGYVCLTIDTIGELAEIEGMHHGTHSGTRWWWNARGYTPAGVETWNAIRALDYLESRPEVDAQRFGVTGRSGGGVGTWWIAAVDERIKVAVPVAGMTDLQDQVVNGKVKSHCDCMFMVNTYRWDYANIGALIAPRPLLFSNSDKDEIFPLDGVMRLHHDIAAIYRLYGATDKLGLLITDGPHQDTQDLQVPAFRWFNRFLKNDRSIIDGAANKYFTPAQLKVLTTIPADQINTTIDQSFIPTAKPEVPATRAAWEEQRQAWLQGLAAKTFAAWPDGEVPLNTKCSFSQTKGSVSFATWQFTSEPAVPLELLVLAGAAKASVIELAVLGEEQWRALLGELLRDGWKVPTTILPAQSAEPSARFRALLDRVARGELTVVFFTPRGIGPTAWSGNATERTHLRRRFMLLGETLESTRVWDIRRALAALAQPGLFGARRVRVTADGDQAVNALYASLYTTNVGELELNAVPVSHATGPDYLNVLRLLDIPQAAALAADRVPVRLLRTSGDWSWTQQTARQLGWPAERFQLSP